MFKQRSQQKEILDQQEVDKKDLFQNLRELDFINTYLGGYSISTNALKKVADKNKHLTLVDIGSGGGDTLKYISKWSKSKNYTFELIGVDLKQACIDYSVTNNPHKKIKFVCDDYINIKNHFPKIDIIHACLFCHHLSETQIIELINFSIKIKSILIINDLERHPFAYYSIKFLTQLFSKSFMVKNDAPLSVLRGFKRKEWEKIISETQAKKYTVKNKWAFRHQIIIYGQ